MHARLTFFPFHYQIHTRMAQGYIVLMHVQVIVTCAVELKDCIESVDDVGVFGAVT